MCEPVKIEVKEGLLLGQKTYTSSGKEFLSFQGIPYAMPPLGILRFKVCDHF